MLSGYEPDGYNYRSERLVWSEVRPASVWQRAIIKIKLQNRNDMSEGRIIQRNQEDGGERRPDDLIRGYYQGLSPSEIDELLTESLQAGDCNPVQGLLKHYDGDLAPHQIEAITSIIKNEAFPPKWLE